MWLTPASAAREHLHSEWHIKGKERPQTNSGQMTHQVREGAVGESPITHRFEHPTAVYR